MRLRIENLSAIFRIIRTRNRITMQGGASATIGIFSAYTYGTLISRSELMVTMLKT